ncbi:MAG: WG repeat-containing protein [Bacteroidetes bacterium]|nr:WG repeat-containing protein [Bacteroidota bacterium]MDA1268036.1 WG repeat-containing protein [Bacteroidota bacterium]
MRNLFYPAAACFLILASPSLGQTWEVYDFSGSLQTRASYQDIDLLGESVSVGKNSTGLFLLSPDLRAVVDLQGQEVFQYLKPWILVKGPKGIGAFHEYGQLALPLEYEEISTYTNRLLARKGKEYWVFEKSTGKIKWLGTAEEAKLTRNGQVILKNQGQYFLPLSSNPEKSYDLLLENQSNFLLAKEASGYGLINQKGDYVLDPVLDQLEHTRGDNYFGFDENQYLLIHGFEESAQVRYNSYHKITKEGELLLEYIHGKLRRVLEEEGILLDAVGMESVKLIGPDAFNIRFRENKLGLLGKKGWLVAPNSDAEWIGMGSEGLFPALKKGKYGYLDATGRWIIAPSFLEVGTFSEKVSTYRNTATWGTINTEGKMVAEAKWDKIKSFSGGIAIAESAGKQYLILPNGELAYPEGLDKILRLREGYYLVESNSKTGLLNSLGKPILPISFDQIQVENKDFFIVSKEGLSGIMRTNGDVFLPLRYTQVAIDWNEQKVLVKSLDQVVEDPETSPEKVPQGKRKKGV